MHIVSNTTGLLAELAPFTDKHGRDLCVAVLKGTFVVDERGAVSLAEEQAPFVFADEHHGDPGASSLKFESDFAPIKPCAEVLVRGYAVGPGAASTTSLTVGLEAGPVKKRLQVSGDRYWEVGGGQTTATPPKAFTQLPLVYERAFGGADVTHANEQDRTCERRNLVGAGFRGNSDPSARHGTPLPNIEYPDQLVQRWDARPAPAGFGPLARSWLPRAAFAGTYDQAWIEKRFPFLPEDFDDRYFLSTPPDQQLPKIEPGMPVRCTNMSPAGPFSFETPRVDAPIEFRFCDRTVSAAAAPDTLTIEPHRRRFMLVWRASVPVGRKFTSLREVSIGAPPARRAAAPLAGSSVGPSHA